MDILRQAEQDALDDGFSGLRATWNMGWVLEGTPGADRLIEYEAHLNRFLAGSRTCALCRYCRESSSHELIQDALLTHPIAILGEQICPNAYDEPPDMVLGDRPVDERVDWMMAQLQRARYSESKLEEVSLRLSQKRSALERADRAKEELLAMLAHELRNPLGTISNALQVLRMKGAADGTRQAGDRRRRAPGPPSGNADRRPPGGLARHSRPGRAAVRGAGPGRARPRDRRRLPRVARRGGDRAQPRRRRRAADDPGGPAPPLPGALEPPRQRRQVHPRGGRIAVRVARTAAGRRAEVSVRDSGAGIPPEELPYVFEVFTQGDHSLDRAQGGWGSASP